MFETTKDLLFVTLAFCAIWLTVFLCWLLYYVMAAVRDVEAVMRQVKNAVERVDHLAHLVQEKVERSAGAFAIGVQAAREIITWAIAQKRAKSESAAKTRRPKRKAEENDAEGD